MVKAAFGLSDRHMIGLNRSYVDRARLYGFRVDPTPTRAPKQKGKVEANVKYIKRNWLPTCDFADFTGAVQDLRTWQVKTANARRHPRTGRVPRDLFEEEERNLLPLPDAKFVPYVWKRATVHPDTHVEFDRRLYSAPWHLVGESVWIRASPESVEIYYDNTRVGTHERTGPGRRSTHEFHLPDGRRDLRHRSEKDWLERADRLGAEVVITSNRDVPE